MTLADARALRAKAKRALVDGRDPGVDNKAAMTAPAGKTFEAVAREWIGAQSATWTPRHSERILSRFERDVFPAIGARRRPRPSNCREAGNSKPPKRCW